MSQMIHPWIFWRKGALFKITHVNLSNFKSFKVIFTKYLTHVIYITHITYITFMTHTTHKLISEKYRKDSEKNSWKVSKSLRRRKNKEHQYSCERYRNLSEKKKNKMRQYGREQYLPEVKKQSLIEGWKDSLILLLMITDHCIKFKKSKI